MNRKILSLGAAVTALAAITGFASMNAPGSSAGTAPAAASRMPVERSGLVCPSPSMSEVAETTYTSFTPKGAGGASGAAELTKAVATEAGASDGTTDEDDGSTDKDDDKAGKDADTDKAPADGKAFLSVKEPGKPVTGTVSGADAPGLVGAASGGLAPGWTTQQTTSVGVGGARGLSGTSCVVPDTDFWFPGASTEASRQDYVHLINPDDTAAVVDIELFGTNGAITSQVGEGITVPARSSVPVLLSTLSSTPAADLTVHVISRTGRVGAVLGVAEDGLGSDWLAASADPADRLVLPGIPADASDVHLVAFAPGQDDADLKIQLVGADGTIVPAGHESLHVKSGMTAAVDLADITRGEAGSLVLSQAGGDGATPVVAALMVVRGKGDDKEMAFIPATGPIEERSTVADNRAKGSTLSLTAPAAGAKVKVTASAGSGGGEPVEKTYSVKGGTTLDVTPTVPSGLKGSYALTVEPESGGPLYAARTLALPEDGVQMFTVQTLPDDRGSVLVPKARRDLSILDGGN